MTIQVTSDQPFVQFVRVELPGLPKETSQKRAKIFLETFKNIFKTFQNYQLLRF